jgi:hypothetical protein
VENFGGNIFANPYSEPQCIVLSSAAVVTAAETVQRGFAADAKKTSTTKDTKYHEGFC